MDKISMAFGAFEYMQYMTGNSLEHIQALIEFFDLDKDEAIAFENYAIENAK
jgi:hypothetical protein